MSDRDNDKIIMNAQTAYAKEVRKEKQRVAGFRGSNELYCIDNLLLLTKRHRFVVLSFLGVK